MKNDPLLNKWCLFRNCFGVEDVGKVVGESGSDSYVLYGSRFQVVSKKDYVGEELSELKILARNMVKVLESDEIDTDMAKEAVRRYRKRYPGPKLD